MSASLVGSEMCIRDSCQACLGVAGNLRQLRAIPGLRPKAPRTAKAQSTSCLLYTSDAADDM
eukprot:709894-Alexandrium_andersonii.AAC.1